MLPSPPTRMATLRRGSGQAKKKKKVKSKVKAKKKVVKKKAAKKTKSKKKSARASKKVSSAKKAMVRKIEAKVKEKILGKVTHYYDKIGVAIVDLESPMKLGDMVKLARGSEELVQVVSSMQIDHLPVLTAKKGDVIGMKVSRPVAEGTVVKPI